MSDDLLIRAREVLQEIWGYDLFRPLQEQSICAALERRDSLTVLPTGGGKSICFQVPAICHEGLAVVVSPLISLMKDQVDALQACGIAAAFVNSTQNDDDKREVASLIRQRKLKLLYVAPERLLMSRMLDFLRQCEVSFFAIDEAHCISNGGHDFRPEYRGLRILKDKFPGVPIHAFTATASAPVRRDIVTQLSLDGAEILVGNFDRPNLTYRMLRANNRLRQVMEVIRRHPGESGIVYCISRKEVERTSHAIVQMGCRALPYHAGMDDEQRKANQDAFIKERAEIIVATVAFGMGIDKSNVRYVIHSGMPKSIEHYQQESGRGGRDGLPAECVLIYSGGDVVTLSQKILSCVLRLQERFGAAHTIKVFTGSKEPRLSQLGHDQLSTYGLLTNDGPQAVRMWIEQLVSQGFLKRTGEYQVLSLTDTGRRLLRRDGNPRLTAPAQSKSSRRVTATEDSWEAVDRGLFEQLRELRSNLAMSRNVPAYIIFGDSVLRDLARYRPVSLNTLGRIKGIGEKKQQDFGETFTQLIKLYCQQHSVASDISADASAVKNAATTVNRVLSLGTPAASALDAFEHFRNGQSIETVAQKMGRAHSTVAGYLQDFIRQERITDSSPWVDEKIRERIAKEFHRFETERLKPIYEHFGGEISYEALRIVTTCLVNAAQTAPLGDDA